VIIEVPTALQGHIFAAVSDYVRMLEHDARRNGREVPVELVQLRDRLEPGVRNAVTDPATKIRMQSAIRMRRSRLRAKGFDVPKRKPGPRPRVAVGQRAS
jgi:hypothetical protein